jgi:glycosyltransferase involved in cell wall biosynthesis
MNPRVLMIAYACNPRGTGEHWLGWGWAEQAARSFQVDLITTTNHQAEVEARARECGVNAHFVGLPPWLRRLTSMLGGAGAWLRKMAWQSRAARLAESLHLQTPFAVVHQTTFHTFRVPFVAARLGIPSVWGPIAGGEYVPPGFFHYLGSAKFSEYTRKLINQLWLRYLPISRSLRRASAIFVSNRTTLGFLPDAVHGKCRVVPPNALRPEDENRPPVVPADRPADAPLRLLYVGNCVATRAIPLVFDALIESGLADCKFTIVGGGPALESWKQKASALALNNRVEFIGRVPHEQLAAYYSSADALVFPALRDSGGSALLEAMSRGLPVICLDWAGPGEMVDETSGLKIPVTDPAGTVKAMAAAFVRLRQDPALGKSLAAAAQKRALALFRWDEKYRILVTEYQRLIVR